MSSEKKKISFDPIVLNFDPHPPHKKHKMTYMRYSLFYSDDLVSNSFKIKSNVMFTSGTQHAFDMSLLQDLEFQQQMLMQGQFFNIDVSPTTPVRLYDGPGLQDWSDFQIDKKMKAIGSDLDRNYVSPSLSEIKDE